MRLFRVLLVFIAISFPLAGCSSLDGLFVGEGGPALEGERLSILELQRNLEPEENALLAQEFVAPAVWNNDFWPQPGGYPNHAMQHLALSEGKLAKVWSASIGRGSSKPLPLISQPILVNGVIYALDSDSRLSAIDAQKGKTLWNMDVGHKDEDERVIGGGIAYAGGTLYVTNGYNEVIAIDPRQRNITWRVTLAAPARAAPTSIDDRVFVTTLDSRIYALDSNDGHTIWEFSGLSETAGLVGAASPAANREIVVPGFSSGEVYALRVENGSVAWSENLSSLNRLGSLATISDIIGLPIIDNGLVIAVSFGGKTVAIDERTGMRVWQREIGSATSPWIAGNMVVLVSTENELVALNRNNGAIKWIQKLPRFKNKDQKTAISWTGPIFAGNRIILASSNGEVIEVNPNDGIIIRRWSAGSSVSVAPIIAGKTLYVLTDNGTLTAYR